MGSIVKSDTVRTERMQYAVGGWGEGELWTGPDAVLAHDFRFARTGAPQAEARRAAASLDATPLGGADTPSGTVARPESRVGNDSVTRARQAVEPDELVTLFAAFLAGQDVPLDEIPLDLGESTPFQRAVTTALRAIPRGEVVTYGELAAIAGYPGAQRATGTICARNRFMLLVPCHRVVASDGIGGYGSAGRDVKRRLPALEGVVI